MKKYIKDSEVKTLIALSKDDNGILNEKMFKDSLRMLSELTDKDIKFSKTKDDVSVWYEDEEK